MSATPPKTPPPTENTNLLSGGLGNPGKLSTLVLLISYALVGNAGNSLFAMDLIPTIVTKNGVTGRFLKISPFCLFWPFFDWGFLISLKFEFRLTNVYER